MRLQEKIQELAREHKQVKGLANQVANLVSEKACLGNGVRTAQGSRANMTACHHTH